MNRRAGAGGLAFILITWLVLALLSGAGVWWGASSVAAVAPPPDGGSPTSDGTSQPTGDGQPQPDPVPSDPEPATTKGSGKQGGGGTPKTKPTGGSSTSSTSRTSSSSPRPSTTSTTSSPASSSSSTTSFDPPTPEFDYSTGYVLIIDTCHKTETGATKDNCTYQELADRTASRTGPENFEILDGADFAGLNDDAWAAVAKGITWGDETSAKSNCADYGRTAGPKCYSKEAGARTY